MGKRERILVCSGEVIGPDGPWLKGEDKLVKKWKISSAVLRGIGCKWVIKSVSSHILQSLYGVSGIPACWGTTGARCYPRTGNRGRQMAGPLWQGPPRAQVARQGLRSSQDASQQVRSRQWLETSTAAVQHRQAVVRLTWWVVGAGEVGQEQ